MIWAMLVCLVIFRHFIGPWALYRLFYSPRTISFWSKWKIQSKAPSPQKVRQDQINSVASIAIDALIILLVAFIHQEGFSQLNMSALNANGFSISTVLVQLLLFNSLFFIQDFYFYITHALLHQPRFFKSIHFVHHQSANPTPWTSFSHHFAESFIELLFYPLVILVLPLNIYVLMLYVFVTSVINFLGHCGFDFRALSLNHVPGLKWIATYTFHNQHHQYFKGNYSLYFNIWDRVFKTQLAPVSSHQTQSDSSAHDRA